MVHPGGIARLAEHLTGELARCDRYHHPLTLVRVELRQDAEAEPPAGATAALMAALQGVRSSDAAFRLAPGSFALVLPETPGIAARHVAARLQHAVQVVEPSAQVAVAFAEAHGTDLDGLLERADPRRAGDGRGPFR